MQETYGRVLDETLALSWEELLETINARMREVEAHHTTIRTCVRRIMVRAQQEEESIQELEKQNEELRDALKACEGEHEKGLIQEITRLKWALNESEEVRRRMWNGVREYCEAIGAMLSSEGPTNANPRPEQKRGQ